MLLKAVTHNISQTLSANVLAAYVLNYYSKEHRFPDCLWMRNINQTAPPAMPTFTTDDRHLDLRFKALAIKGIRKYGNAGHNLYYGIDFRQGSSQPCSLVLLGKNGSGKTSLFTAMEIAGKGQSDIALLRGYDSERHPQYLRHANFQDNECIIKIVGERLIGGTLDQLSEPLLHKACFCSDYDVEQLEKTDNYTNYIIEQVGLTPFMSLRDDLNKLNQLLLADKNNGTLSEEEYNVRKNDTDSFILEISRQLSLKLGEIGPLIKDMMEEIVADYFLQEDGERFQVNIDEENGLSFDIEFFVNNRSDGVKNNRSPRAFLNTFRFKLFIFSLKLAIGLCMKIYNQIDCPYIIDDMFDSSDFDNRTKIGDYFSKVLRSHDRILRQVCQTCHDDTSLSEERRGERISFYHSLLSPQIIFLTQDELIATSLYDGLSRHQDVTLGRLFLPDEADGYDIKNIIVEIPYKDGYAALNIEFKNLYDTVRQTGTKSRQV